jgi:hypothetical protein
MRPLTDNNIEAELSYAYLHAVAAKNAMACRAGDRHEDNNGIDAQLSAWGSWLSVGHKSFFRRDIRHGPTGDPFWAGPCVPTEKASKGRGTRAVTTKM